MLYIHVSRQWSLNFPGICRPTVRPKPVSRRRLPMVQTGRSPISKVAKLHVGHPARKVGDHAARGFTIAAAFFAFTRATSTSASNAKATPMRRLTKLSGLPNRGMSVLGTRSASATPSNTMPLAMTRLLPNDLYPLVSIQFRDVSYATASSPPTNW